MPGRGLIALTLLMAALSATGAAAWAGHRDEHIVLPGATSAEGIAKGSGSTFYAGELFGGRIYKGDLRHGTAELFVTGSTAGKHAVGMVFDARHSLLFVAGGWDGSARVYDGRTGDLVASYQFGAAPAMITRDEHGSRRLMIGRTDGGRVLTLVIERTVEPTTWLIVTGWSSTDAERNLLRGKS